MFECDKIKYSKMQNTPFRYVEVNNVFPVQMYRNCLKLFPTPEEMVSTYGTDRRLDIAPFKVGEDPYDDSWVYGNKLKGRKLEFWTEFKDRFYQGEFVAELAKKFGIEESVEAYGGLYIDRTKNKASQVDNHTSLLNVVVYIDNNKLSKGIDFLDAEGETVKSIEYYPNKLVAWETGTDAYTAYRQETTASLRTIRISLKPVDRNENVSSDPSEGRLETDTGEEPDVVSGETLDSPHD